tara:strand:- start:48 stop:401 length:354 start_codon:yes stop_codon:yes gene_type:complete
MNAQEKDFESLPHPEPIWRLSENPKRTMVLQITPRGSSDFAGFIHRIYASIRNTAHHRPYSGSDPESEFTHHCRSPVYLQSHNPGSYLRGELKGEIMDFRMVHLHSGWNQLSSNDCI